ncbi:hypothetical protein [Dictyobacter aurantiacus]|uniref:Uncharacterized protein n=1 Tax=Dictyobacter aurantiacus TaxID=1936993 RepID=A0A401ZR03_9CHLR|nr:hypothetical protein [Dictyobacter aurantiacus]GCE09262.1 hypothetical protein KDAU_65910 [Dictyobacter aurantiacus]
MMAFHDSAWIRFLRQYGPVPTNDNMYDEFIQKAARSKKMHPVSFTAEYLDVLIDNFQSNTPVSVILTGTAGDGKTYYCRQIWTALNGTEAAWTQKSKIRTLRLPSGRTLIVIKDLSEFSAEEAQTELPQIAASIDRQNTEYVYLIAANDGQLMEKWRDVTATPQIVKVRQAIENLLVNEQRDNPDFALRLYNLSRLPIRRVFPRILDAVLNHEGWQTCDQCPFRQATASTQQCPIWENKERLQNDPTTRERILQLLELCELNNVHIPVRQLLLLVSNMILGHPNTKDHLMTCKDVVQVIDNGDTAQASLYRNIFGENLGKRRRQSTEVFVALNRFGIGNETNSSVDSMLIFGQDDPSQKENYQRFVLSDTYYGADHSFQSQQNAYLEGTTADNGEKFLSMLRAQRQRLFFTLPPEAAAATKLWSLTVFQYAGEYLDIIEKLRQSGKITSKQSLARLVQGLNRIFTGLLAHEAEHLILATSGSHSQARVCHVLEDYVSVSKKAGVYVNLELDHNERPLLTVSLGKEDGLQVPLRLQLTRFEFLCRVAEGALPSSFSRECYEDILSFKTNLLRQLDYRRRLYDDDPDAELTLNMIYLDNEGDIKESSLEVQFS